MTIVPRALVAVYAFFALAAGARGVVQTALAPGRAPLAHGLTLLAAAVYLVAASTMHRGTDRALRAGAAALTFELAGVTVVGTLTTVTPHPFGADTVWSDYGAAYGWVPLVLPVVGLVTLARLAARRRARRASARRLPATSP